MATIKKLNFASGTDVTAPTDLSYESATNHLESHVDDAAFVAANGAANNGDAYINTTLNVVRYYSNGSWSSASMSSLTETLTNKTIDATANTLSNIPFSATTGTLAPSRGGTGVANNDAATLTRSGNHALTMTTTAPTSVTLPTAGTLATLAGSEVFTNKDIDGGTASNTNRITVPKAAKTALDALTRKEGTILYGTDTKKHYTDDGTTLNEMGGGAGGAAGRNYLQNWYTGLNPISSVTGLTTTGNRTSSQTLWGASATGNFEAINNVTTPLRESGDIKLDSKNTTINAFIETPMFNIDQADLSKAVVVSFDVTGNLADGNYDVVVIRYNSSGTYQETISVAGNASSGTPASAKLPTGTTTFKGFFITSNTQSDLYSVRFRKLLAVNNDVQIDSLFVGPQSLSAGVAVTDWQSFTPTLAAGWGTVSASEHYYRRVGDTLEVRGRFTTGTIAGGSATIGLPSGLNINTSVFVTSGREHRVGICQRIRSGASATVSGDTVAIIVNTAVSNSVQMSADSSSGSFVDSSTGSLLVSGDDVAYYYSVPISQWSSNVTMAERAVEEYAFSTATTTTAGASDTTNFGYGPQGVQFNSINSTTINSGSRTTYRVRFQSPILPTDALFLEYTSNGGITWTKDIEELGTGIQLANLTVYGAYIKSQVNSTDVDIGFGNGGRRPGVSYGGVGSGPWSDIAGNPLFKWRVRKVSSGGQVGFPIAPANIALMNTADNYSGNTKLGLMQYLHGTTYNGGNAPTVTSGQAGFSVNRSVFVPYQMADGTWRLKFNISADFTGASISVLNVNVAGITSGITVQAVAGIFGTFTGAVRSYLNNSSNTLTSTISSASTATNIMLSGDVELASKPTWAY